MRLRHLHTVSTLGRRDKADVPPLLQRSIAALQQTHSAAQTAKITHPAGTLSMTFVGSNQKKKNNKPHQNVHWCLHARDRPKNDI